MVYVDTVPMADVNISILCIEDTVNLSPCLDFCMRLDALPVVPEIIKLIQFFPPNALLVMALAEIRYTGS